MRAITDLSLTDEEQEIRHAVGRFLKDIHPIGHTRALMDDSREYDGDVWKRLVVELGVAGVAVPEARGGQGYGPFAMGVIAEELGRHLVPGPFMPTVALGTLILMACHDEQAADLLARIATGSATTRVALAGPHGSSTISVRQQDDSWHLDGSVGLVPAADPDSTTLVVAELDGGELGVFELQEDPVLERLVSNDLTRAFDRLRLEDAPARRLVAQSQSVARALDSATVILAAESLGAAQASLDMAVDYAKHRVQFGRAIGSFQYVKHLCADLLMKVEGARSTVVHALRTASGTDDVELAIASSLAKRVTDEVAWEVVRQSIQLLGGIGFTWEHDAHLFLRRIMANRQLLGTSTWHGDRLEELLEFA